MNPSASPAPYDALVIGGGPAGSTVATLLAQKGRRVLLVEKERFPRYHIGESLMPYCWFPLERLGVIERLKSSRYPKKYSVQFVTTDGRVSQPFYFFQHLNHDAAQTWQVWRGEFDAMLLDNARGAGVEVREATAARALLRTESTTAGAVEGAAEGAVVGARIEGADGRAEEVRARVTIDASGRDAFAALAHGWRVFDPALKKHALWTYYKGALRDPGLDEGATTVAYVPGKGWFWYIPLPDDVVSVGIVAERDYLYGAERDPQTIFEREIRANPWIERHLAPGRRMEGFRTTGEYSYRARHCAADGLVLVGDAFAFLDPIFSSGVFLALKSGELAAEAAHAALAAGDVTAGRFAAYGETMIGGIEAMRRLVYAFYDPGFSFRELIQRHPDQKGALTDCLIGHLLRDFEPLFGAVAEFARLPAPLPYGTPLAGGRAAAAGAAAE
ncbi:MAG: tryptophan 7-halogenase [Planctomycetes bacterium]|nr:tryptophan 7-halogenase [Planctomycetota bacterium]